MKLVRIRRRDGSSYLAELVEANPMTGPQHRRIVIDMMRGTGFAPGGKKYQVDVTRSVLHALKGGTIVRVSFGPWKKGLGGLFAPKSALVHG